MSVWLFFSVCFIGFFLIVFSVVCFIGFFLNVSKAETGKMKASLLTKIAELGKELPLNTLDELIDKLGGPEKVSEVLYVVDFGRVCVGVYG